MMRLSTNIILSLFFVNMAVAQTVTIEGYVFENNNRGYIENATIAVLDGKTEALTIETTTDEDGFFTVDVPNVDHAYIVVANHKEFFVQEALVDIASKKDEDKCYAKIEMERKPGYIIDVTMAERKEGQAVVDAIAGARIEIFNNTTSTEALVLEEHPSPNFQFNFKEGNHYTILIRKDGYLARRIEAYVDIEGCILCIDGIGSISPNMTDVLTHGNQMGTLLANLELERIELDKTYKIENIYYDFNKWDIRADAAEELDKVAQVLRDNPTITIELGSHTDARGPAVYNSTLSQKRAASAVEYLITTNNITAERLTSRGYGETTLINRCGNGVSCTEAEHQQNRRTELKIIGIQEDERPIKPLKQLIMEERSLKEIQNSDIIEIKAGEAIPDEIKNQLKGENEPNSH